MSAQWGYTPPSRPTVVYASWGRRALASLADGLVAFGFLVVVSIPLGIVSYAWLDEQTLRAVIDYVSVAFLLAFLMLYFPLTMRRQGEHNGQTWGKQLCGIRVMREDGEPVDARLAIQREVLLKYLVFWVLSAFLLFIPTTANSLWPVWDDRNQALHDKIARTFVVKRVAVTTYASGSGATRTTARVRTGKVGSVTHRLHIFATTA